MIPNKTDIILKLGRKGFYNNNNKISIEIASYICANYIP